MSSRFFILSVIFLLFLNSCTKSLADDLSDSIKAQIKNTKSSCGITFKNTFNFNWGELYIFDSMMYPEEISEVLGVEYKGEIVTDGNRLIIFTLNGQIVKDFESSFSGVNFVGMRRNGYINLYRNKKFCVEQRLLNKIHQFYLFPEN